MDRVFRSGTYPTIGKTFKVEKYGAEAVKDVRAKGPPRWRDSPNPIISQDSTPPFRKVPDSQIYVVSCGFIWKKPWFLRVFLHTGDGRIQPGAVVGIYENDETAKTVTELFTKAVELGIPL